LTRRSGFLLAATLSVAEGAWAAPPRTASLSWVRLPGADACVSTQDLAKDVEKLLGRRVFVSASQGDVSVEGRIEHKPKGGFRATISVRDAKGVELGTREIEGAKECSTMRDELAIVIAVMIDPDAMSRPPEPPPPPWVPPAPPPPPAVTVTPSQPAPAPLPAQPAGPRQEPANAWHLETGASVAAEVGLLPHATLGVRVDALLTPPGFIPLEAYGEIWPYDTTQSGASNGAFTLAWGGGGLCPLAYSRGRFLAYGCASGIAGVVFSQGQNGGPNGPQALLAGALETRVAYRIGGPFAVRLGLAAEVPILRPYRDSTTAGSGAPDYFRTTVVTGTADAGLGLEF
jgi:hypothetical protein